METLLTIQMMSTRYGVTTRALRFYEEKGMLRPSRSGSKRLYGAMDQYNVNLIIQGINLGFSLREIADVLSKISNGCGTNRSIISGMRTAEINAHIAALEEKKLSIDRSIKSIKSAMAA